MGLKFIKIGSVISRICLILAIVFFCPNAFANDQTYTSVRDVIISHELDMFEGAHKPPTKTPKTLAPIRGANEIKTIASRKTDSESVPKKIIAQKSSDDYFERNWPAVIRPGMMTREGSTVGYLDYFLPLVQNQTHLIYFNPKASLTDDDSHEENLGIGYRELADTVILGANIFYDNKKTTYQNWFQQVGAGVEMLTEPFDFRFNYYYPLTKAKELSAFDTFAFGEQGIIKYGGFEEPLRGFDYELGWLVPVLSNYLETRIYGGGFYYDSKKFKNKEGARLRVEVNPTPLLTLEFKKDYDIRAGESTSYGGYMTLPFEVGNIFKGKNPFDGWKDVLTFGKGARPLKERMTERVVRDIDITSERGTSTTSVLNTPLVYVDDSNTGSEDGSLSHPFSSVAEAITNIGSKHHIYVQEGTYTERVTLPNNTTLVGAADNLDFPNLPTGNRPVLQGDGLSGALEGIVTLGLNNTIRGLEFQNEDIGIMSASSGGHIKIQNNVFKDLGQAGVPGAGALTLRFLSGDTSIDIHNNAFNNNNTSIGIVGDLTANINATISDNTMRNNASAGVVVGTLPVSAGGSGLASGNVTATVSNNIMDTGLFGVIVLSGGASIVTTHFNSNIIKNNAGGISLGPNETATTNITISQNSITNNGAGVSLLENDGNFSLNINSNVITGNDVGISLDKGALGIFTPDFGGGVLGSTGQNSIFGNTTADLLNQGGVDNLKAENNYWGGGAANTTGSTNTVDDSPFLTTNPNP